MSGTLFPQIAVCCNSVIRINSDHALVVDKPRRHLMSEPFVSSDKGVWRDYYADDTTLFAMNKILSFSSNNTIRMESETDLKAGKMKFAQDEKHSRHLCSGQ